MSDLQVPIYTRNQGMIKIEFYEEKGGGITMFHHHSPTHNDFIMRLLCDYDNGVFELLCDAYSIGYKDGHAEGFVGGEEIAQSEMRNALGMR